MHEQGGLVVRVLALAQGFEETATIRLPLAVLAPAGAERGGRRERAHDLEWECQAPAGTVSWCALLLACARVSLPFCTCVRMYGRECERGEVRNVQATSLRRQHVVRPRGLWRSAVPRRGRARLLLPRAG